MEEEEDTIMEPDQPPLGHHQFKQKWHSPAEMLAY
jgi:hypothetical protein